MRVKRKQFEGFYIIRDHGEAYRCMVLQGAWRDQYEAIVKKEGITALRLSRSLGWRQDDISFLKSLTQLRSIEIYNWAVSDISPLEKLPRLQKVGLECNFRKPIDFSALASLTECSIRWRPNSDTLFSAVRLEHLSIVNYPCENLNPLRALRRLRELKLTSSKLKTLTGVVNLDMLESLDLFRCVGLESLDAIQDARALTRVYLDACRKVASVEPLSGLESLRHLHINNCGVIESLGPLRSCRSLSQLFFTEKTVVRDGDMSIFQELPDLESMWFTNRKHYTHTREEIQEKLKSKGPAREGLQ